MTNLSAKDLRIGNLLYFKNDKGKKVVTEVESVHETGINVGCSSSYGCADLYRDEWHELEPIPLTPEILIAAGFATKQASLYWFYNRKYPRFKLWYDTGSVEFHYTKASGTYIVVEYLHQIQNIFFVLEQEELTINLNQLQQA